mgnify:CR=1 FL=1
MSRNKENRFLILLSIIVSFFIGIRFLDVGKDTEQYLIQFNKYSSIESVFNGYEIGFSLLMHLFSKYTSSVEFFFFFVSLLITSIYLLFFKRIYLRNFIEESFNFDRMIFFFSLLLLSSWYLTMTTNGLRQGIALVFLYYGLFDLFYNNRKFKFIIFYLISISFHYSVLIVGPFLLLKYVRFRLVFAVWILTAVGYIYGVNELIIKLISAKFNLPVYDFIKLYSLDRGVIDGGLYNGFSLKFFIYTVFWPLLLMFIFKIKLRVKSSSLLAKETLNLIKIYLILSMPYFIFGFGPFSNRYAMLAWFLVPVLQFHILNTISIKNNFKIFLVIFSIITFLFFLFFRLQWIRVLV